jgi:hypothetical protein
MNHIDSEAILAELETDELELAEQLLALRQKPGPELRRRVEAIPDRRRAASLTPRLVGGMVAAAAVMLLLSISPPAQATLGRFEAVIGRIHLTMLDVLPHRPTPVIIESTPVSLPAARAQTPFDFAVPAQLPAGLIGEPQILVTKLEMPIVKIRWRDINGGFVQLAVHQANDGQTLTQNLIGVESSQTISLNGQEAVLIYGGWDKASRTWDHQAQLVTLIWELEDIQYNLLAYSEAVPLPELIVMAESVHSMSEPDSGEEFNVGNQD